MARRGGGGNLFLNAIWAIFILSCVFAWFKTPVPASTEGAWNYLKAKSVSAEAWVKNFTSDGGIDLGKLFNGSGGLTVNIDGKLQELGGDGKTLGDILGGIGDNTSEGKNNSSGVSATKSEIKGALSKVDKLKIGSDNINYDRGEWKHWSNSGSSCWNVREEVLAKQGANIVYLDKNNKETQSKSKACSIKSGKWEDPYTGKTLTDPSKIDIDHMVPLSYTAKHGGQKWSASKKEEYANNTKNSYHLIAVDAGANRAKGDKGPSKWMPANKAYQCKYVAQWVAVSAEWKLTIDQADADKIKATLKKC